jgi:hypothetical protein
MTPDHRRASDHPRAESRAYYSLSLPAWAGTRPMQSETGTRAARAGAAYRRLRGAAPLRRRQPAV